MFGARDTWPAARASGFTRRVCESRAGTSVKTGFNGATLTSTAGADGTWRQALPPTAAGGPYNLTFSASTGESAALSNVLFGDVYICGGQSNMQFTVDNAFNATAEVAAANGYPNVRARRGRVEHAAAAASWTAPSRTRFTCILSCVGVLGSTQIRVFTVGQGTTSNVTLTQLATIAQGWSVASAASIGVGNWSEFRCEATPQRE